MTDDTTTVVVEAEAIEYAYEAGYERFSGSDDVDGEIQESLSAYIGSSQYANTVLPDLRAAAGADDSGTGTYGDHREVVLIPVGEEDDQPREGETVDSSRLADALTDVWHEGALDGLSGGERDLTMYSRL